MFRLTNSLKTFSRFSPKIGWKASFSSCNIELNKLRLAELVKFQEQLKKEGLQCFCVGNETIIPSIIAENKYKICETISKSGIDEAFRSASGTGQISALEIMVKTGINLNASDYYGNTPLMTAAENGQIETIRFLLNLKADLKCTNNIGRNVLMLAVSKPSSSPNQLEIIRLLLSFDKSLIDETDRWGHTVLMLAVFHGNQEIVQELLNAGADVHKKDDYGETALMIAIKCWHQRIANLLIEKTFNINLANRFGETLLMKAAISNQLNVVEALLNAGVNINQTDQDGNTALMLAIEYDQLEAIDLLLKQKDIDINLQNKYGETALMCAVFNGNLNSVTSLLKSGAETSLKNEDRETALEIAERLDRRNMIEALSQAPNDYI